MHAPAVTLIVITYNQAKYVDDALASVVAQTSDEFEVVLIDDASSDGSADRLRSWLPKLAMPARLIVNERNLGVSGAKNVGLAHARGEFICGLSGDDVYAPAKIERALHVFRKVGPEVAVVFGDALLMSDDGRLGRRYFAGSDGVPEGRIFNRLCAGSFFPTPSTMVRRAAIDAVGGYDPRRYAEDYDMWLRLAAADYEFRYVDEVLVHYRLSPLGMSRDPAKQPRLRESVSRSLLAVHGRAPHTDEVISRRTWSYARWIFARDPALGRPLLRDVCSTDPSLARRLQVFGSSLPGASAMLGSLYRVRDGYSSRFRR